MNVGQIIGRWLGQARQLSFHQMLLIGGWLLALTVIEIRGRESRSDLADALSLMEILLLLAFTLMLDFRWVVGIVGRAAVAIRNAVTHLFAKRLLLGLDLRREPPLPRAIPLRWRVVMSTLLALNVCVVIGCGYLPASPRLWLHDRFYLGYLLLLTLLWIAVSITIFVMGFVAWAGIHDYFVTRFSGSGARPKRMESMTLMGVLVAGVGAALILPPWTPLALYAVLLATWTVCCLCCRDGFQLLWKHRDGDNVSSVNGHLAQWFAWLAPMLFAGLLVLLTRGHVLIATEPITVAMMVMPITTALGVILSWAVVGGMTATALSGLHMLRTRRQLRPHQKYRRTLHVSGETDRQSRKQIRAAVRPRGWRVRFAPAKAVKGDVPIRFCRHLAEQESGWPLAVTLKCLASEQTLDRLARRDEIQSRRLVLHGLERILKRAARLRDRPGTGSWIGLQHWFVLGLTRDKEADFTQDQEATAVASILGPPFHALIPCHARRHYQRITSALAIDLIFVEDGVTFRRLTRVFRMMFEVYDVHGGKRRAEERDFVGLPGVRVMLHEFSIVETTHQVERGYPEPDYEDIGRARILHIFKDREEEDAWEPLPWETDDVPLLSGSGM